MVMALDDVSGKVMGWEKVRELAFRIFWSRELHVGHF